MTMTLAATYPTLADALRTRHELQELRIPSEDISVAMRRGSVNAADPDQPEILTLGWLERAIAGWPTKPGETDIAKALRRAGIHEQIAAHLAYDVDHGGVLIATVIDAPAHRESAELTMAKRARFPDLIGEATSVGGKPVEAAKGLRTPAYASPDHSPRA